MISQKQQTEIWESLDYIQEKLLLIQSILRIKETNPLILNDLFRDHEISWMIEAERLQIYKVMKSIS